MKKIKDRVFLGAISGIATSIPGQIVNSLIYKKGITDVSYSYSASKVFLDKSATKKPAAKVLSSLVNFTSSGLTGTIIAYTLALTGKDKVALKGAGIGAMMWVGIAGLLTSRGLNVRSKKPVTPIISLAEHIITCALCGSLIAKLGQDSLFPDKAISEQEKVPVFYTGQD